jgi:tetratricopeptide (TPR) repeat protein
MAHERGNDDPTTLRHTLPPSGAEASAPNLNDTPALPLRPLGTGDLAVDDGWGVADADDLTPTDWADPGRPALDDRPLSEPVAVESPAAPVGDDATVTVSPSPLPIETPPLPADLVPPTAGPSWLSDVARLQREAQRLARAGRWRDLPALYGYALRHATYASGVARGVLLLELAQLYRDRLGDPLRAEQVFAALAQQHPANTEALAYLAAIYEQRHDWDALYALYFAAVEATWDPHQRLEWTRRAESIATAGLGEVDLAIAAWAQLWRLGDGEPHASRALSRYYRQTARWAELAQFLEQRLERSSGPAQLVVLRELAEVALSGLHDEERAAAVLERILALSPADPVALLQLARLHAQVGDWATLVRLVDFAQTAALSGEAVLDLLRFAADALWQADRLDEAMVAVDAVLQRRPLEPSQLTRKQQFLVRSGRHEELLQLLLLRAESAEPAERGRLLEQAARLAEEQLQQPAEAARLWEARALLEPPQLPAYDALARLYESLGDAASVARVLSQQRTLEQRPAQRLALLRRLGEHYATRLGDDAGAERCWKEMLDLDAADVGAREQLAALHRRRGNFEALNSALLRQIWLTPDPARALSLCRQAAQNIDDNVREPLRAVEAWRRVLDLAADDPAALRALAGHYATLGESRQLVAVLERQLAVVTAADQRLELGLRCAALLQQLGATRAAMAVYERLLRWTPSERRVYEPLHALYLQHGWRGLAAGVLDFVAAHQTLPERALLLRGCLDLHAEQERVERWALLRRLLYLGEPVAPLLAELATLAEGQPELQRERAALLAELAGEQQDAAARAELLRELAGLLEHELAAPERAFVVLQSALLGATPSAEHAAELERLAHTTRHWEEWLAVLDVQTRPDQPLAVRKDALARRAQLCLEALGDPLRAFEEQRRRLRLDPHDGALLADLVQLCETQHAAANEGQADRRAGRAARRTGLWQAASQLWLRLDAVLVELSDHSESIAERCALLRRREEIARRYRGELGAALELMLARFRLSPHDQGLRQELLDAAATQGAWAASLPLLEAVQRTAREGEPPTAPYELVQTASLYETKLGDEAHALTLYGVAFIAEPGAPALLEKLGELATRTAAGEALVDVLRTAAAKSSDQALRVTLLRRIARSYETSLGAPERAIDIHRRLFDLQPDELASLEVLLAWHRERGEWRDLRDRLHQWVGLRGEHDDAWRGWLEIAELSQRLGEPEAALEAYDRVLGEQPDQRQALEGLQALVGAVRDTGLRRRLLRMEIAHAPRARATELQLELARLQELEDRDPATAIATLQPLAVEDGGTAPVFAALARLLRQEQRWAELLALLLHRAEHPDAAGERAALLDQALVLADEQLGSGEAVLRERLYRRLLMLRPGDAELRSRLLVLLRSAERASDLAAALGQELELVDQPHERIALMYELARLEQFSLQQPARAQAWYERILALAPAEEGAILALAQLARAAGDWPAYVARRTQQAVQLEPREAALVLCHLAEIGDERGEPREQIVAHYREARALDASNVPAMEALKGIGRRLKSIRPMAALLPLEGERELKGADRARRLRVLGDDAATNDSLAALEWYRRAVAVDPDGADGWAALARAYEGAQEPAAALRAWRQWLLAQQRSEPPRAERLRWEAACLFAVAQAARRAGDDDEYQRLVRRAHVWSPGFVPAALTAAQFALDQGQAERARRLLDEVLAPGSEQLESGERAEALFLRGSAWRRIGEATHALDDLQQVLQQQPLHAGALVAAAELLALEGRPSAALEHQMRALMVVDDPAARARLYYEAALLLEDELGRSEEAGAFFELALDEGLQQHELLLRLMRYYQRSGRTAESLAVLDRLIAGAAAADELAGLWLARAQVLVQDAQREREAIESFDMALSYDPSHAEARAGLAAALERRGDWGQLLQVLEASCDSGSDAERAQTLRRMADICRLQQNDAGRAEAYLRQSVALQPTREAVAQLERLYAGDPARRRDHRLMLGLLVAHGPPWFERAMELGRALLGDEDRWAWCLLSPLLGVSQVDAELRAVLQEMRKDHERPPLLGVPAEGYSLLVHPQVSPRLSEVLAELSALQPALPAPSPEVVAALAAAVVVGPQTGLGKKFEAIVRAMGLGACSLLRTQTLPEPMVLLQQRGVGLQVVVRTELLQQLVHAEVGFLFAHALELLRPGHRLAAALPPALRTELLPALWSVLGLSVPGGGSEVESALARAIGEVVDEPRRLRWRQRLDALEGQDPRLLGQRWWQGVTFTAHRAGLVAGADLRQALRVIARLDESLARPRVVARLDELDSYAAGSAALRDLVAFAASPAFGELLRSATVLERD